MKVVKTVFDSITHIDVDRKNSLPVADFLERYRGTSTPVVFGDLTRRWKATQSWSCEFFEKMAGDQIVPLHSSKPVINQGRPNDPVKSMPLKDYLGLIQSGEKDLRLHFYNIFKHAPVLNESFSYPRLGLNYATGLTALFAGGRGTVEPMQSAVDLADIILAHFGGPKSVLLIPPEQAHYLYRIPHSFVALPTIKFDQPDFLRHPALRNLNGYVAHLEHGDTLYIPSGYWYCVKYHDVGFSLALRALPTDLPGRLRMIRNTLLGRPWDILMYKLFGRHWVERNIRRALRRTKRYI